MTYTVLAWGCGLQSTTLGVMAATGDLPRPDVLLHTDLGWEKRATRALRAWYTRYFQHHGLEVVLLAVGDIRQAGAADHLHMPFFTETGAPLSRQCTRSFKVRPARRWLRDALGYPASTPPHPPPGAAVQWIGFSLDEWERMKPSGVDYVANRWPLIDRRMTRADCAAYLARLGLPVPVKSSCIGCPFTSAREWLDLRATEPASWAEAVAFDRAIRDNPLPGSRAERLYLWQGCEPLETVDLEAAAARARAAKQLPMLLCDNGGCWV